MGCDDLPCRRFHLNEPDQAKAVADAVGTCQNIADSAAFAGHASGCQWSTHRLQIAEQLGVQPAAIFNWVNALKEGGVEGLLAREHGGGSAPRVQGRILAEFQAGLKAGQWKRAKEIQRWLEPASGEGEVGLKGVYYLYHFIFRNCTVVCGGVMICRMQNDSISMSRIKPRPSPTPWAPVKTFQTSSVCWPRVWLPVVNSPPSIAEQLGISGGMFFN